MRVEEDENDSTEGLVIKSLDARGDDSMHLSTCDRLNTMASGPAHTRKHICTSHSFGTHPTKMHPLHATSSRQAYTPWVHHSAPPG